MGDYLAVKQACPDCSSSDALVVNDNGSTKCYSCGKFTRSSEATITIPEDYTLKTKQDFSAVEMLLTTGTYTAVKDRGITQKTAQLFGCYVGVDAVTGLDKTYFSYHKPDDAHTPVAAKVRGTTTERDEDTGEMITKKNFYNIGALADTGLYGQHLFSGGGKYITVTEGEFDAMAAYQMQGSKYPCVSIKNGASGALADCKAAYEWLDTFDCIVIAFDADEAGTKAAREVAELFGGKSSVMKHTNGYKDANDYLLADKVREFTAAWWAAERFVPDGIINGASLWDEVCKPLEKAAVMYPWDELNGLTYGIRSSELVTVTAGSGLGKSQFLREIVWHILQETTDNIGLLFLEENARKSALGMMSLAANKPLHLPTTESTEDERYEAFQATMGTQRLFLFDHFGSTSVDNIIARVRYMAKALDCKYIFLDHVSIVVSAGSNGDERKALDEIMTKLRMLVSETGIALFIVSHLKRPDGKGHEEGAASSLSQLRGSGGIAQISDMVIGLERNGQAEDMTERNTTHIRVLKNRFSGTTGKSSALLFNADTGRMVEIPNGEDTL